MLHKYNHFIKSINAITLSNIQLSEQIVYRIRLNTTLRIKSNML